MIIIDIDDFAETNHRFGYSAGDEVLKQFARGLVEGSRRKDPFFRYRTGDEFAVLALNQSRDDARAFAARICRETRQSEYEVRDTSGDLKFVTITVSAGVAELPALRPGTHDFEEIARQLDSQAQAALRLAKEGKDRVVSDLPGVSS